VVGVGSVSGEDVHLAEEHLLLIGRALIPVLKQILGPGCQLRVFRNHSKFLLVVEDGLAQLVPAAVEQAQLADLVHPFFGWVVRGMRATRRVVNEEGLLGIEGIDAVHVIDRIIRHGRGQVPRAWRFSFKRVDLRGIAIQIWLPLVRVAAHEPVEILEAHTDRPLVEWSVLAGLVRRCVVLLAEPRSAIAVFLENAADRRLVLGDDAVVARVAG
jgi:hypothetical protein